MKEHGGEFCGVEIPPVELTSGLNDANQLPSAPFQECRTLD